MKVIGWLRRNESLVDNPEPGMGFGFILNGVPYPMIALTPSEAIQLPQPKEAPIGFPVAWAPYNDNYIRVFPAPQCDLELFTFEMKAGAE